MHPFSRSVGAVDLWAEGNHVHAGDTLADQAAFQPGVDGGHFRVVLPRKTARVLAAA